MREPTFSLTQKTKGKLPRLPFGRIKEAVLGTSYTLSLAFVGDTRGRTLYRQYARKNKQLNVLAFPLSENSGEIIINPHQAKREGRIENKNEKAAIGYLFIHGLLHLKGLSHGSTMEREEKKLLAQFNLM